MMYKPAIVFLGLCLSFLKGAESSPIVLLEETKTSPIKLTAQKIPPTTINTQNLKALCTTGWIIDQHTLTLDRFPILQAQKPLAILGFPIPPLDQPYRYRIDHRTIQGNASNNAPSTKPYFQETHNYIHTLLRQAPLYTLKLTLRDHTATLSFPIASQKARVTLLIKKSPLESPDHIEAQLRYWMLEKHHNLSRTQEQNEECRKDFLKATFSFKPPTAKFLQWSWYNPQALLPYMLSPLTQYMAHRGNARKILLIGRGMLSGRSYNTGYSNPLHPSYEPYTIDINPEALPHHIADITNPEHFTPFPSACFDEIFLDGVTYQSVWENPNLLMNCARLLKSQGLLVRTRFSETFVDQENSFTPLSSPDLTHPRFLKADPTLEFYQKH